MKAYIYSILKSGGPIASTLSKSPFKLISKGAKLVISAEDILSSLKIKNDQKNPVLQGLAGQKTKFRFSGF